MTDANFSEKLRQLTKDVGIAMLTSMTSDGRHVSRPMAVQQAEGDADLWFFTYEDSDKVREVSADPRVNVALSKGNAGPWVSISGQAQVVHDPNKVEELWSPLLKGWFPDGKETEGLTLIRVDAESAEYWESAGSRIATVVSFAKAVVTGKTAADEIGTNESGEL
jgi:general stress protein 26